MANVIWGNSNDSMASTAAPNQSEITDAASAAQLSRIADSLDIIIRMIREDMEESKKRWAKKDE